MLFTDNILFAGILSLLLSVHFFIRLNWVFVKHSLVVLKEPHKPRVYPPVIWGCVIENQKDGSLVYTQGK
jgi:hypothetical protein